ncbi:hypothetical protein E1285_37745 [Actinomadura sp. 7K507]|nr:hypothetical protein E1285_37745 [Actinomadura sp. 7K507]
MMSCPPSAIGRASSWMGNAFTMPSASRASAISGTTPSSRKVVRAFSLQYAGSPLPGAARLAGGRRPVGAPADRFLGRALAREGPAVAQNPSATAVRG